MTVHAGDACPLCPGELTAGDTDDCASRTTWLRCPSCRRWYDGHGHAYDSATWQPVDFRHPAD